MHNPKGSEQGHFVDGLFQRETLVGAPGIDGWVQGAQMCGPAPVGYAGGLAGPCCAVVCSKNFWKVEGALAHSIVDGNRLPWV